MKPKLIETPSNKIKEQVAAGWGPELGYGFPLMVRIESDSRFEQHYHAVYEAAEADYYKSTVKYKEEEGVCIALCQYYGVAPMIWKYIKKFSYGEHVF